MFSRRLRQRGMPAVAAASVLALLAACGGGSGDDGSTLTWWHNADQDPGRSVWQGVADDYHEAHPDVNFDVVPTQNEQFQTRIPVALRGDNPPDIYQQWGGGAEATQVESGKLMDMTDAVADWIGDLGPAAAGWQVDGKQYGIPYDLHIVGFWYRTDLFERAGITEPPATIDDLNADVAKLKAAGITPISVGSRDRWPDAFFWEYFVLRECPQDVVEEGIASLSMDDPCFVKAGEDLSDFLATDPFQPGFEATPAQQGATSSAGMLGNGQAAMELQGDWELSVMPSLTDDEDIASKLSWFPFPAVPGGAGDPHAALGGGDGFSCTINATAACPDFLKYVASADVQRHLVETTAITLPANPEANSAISDPTLKTVLEYLQETPYNQTYFDQALPTDVGQALNDAVANFFSGQGTPESIPAAVSA